MWGDRGVSKRLIISNGATAWGVGNTQVRTDIPQVGIARSLRVISNSGVSAFTAGTGTIALDKQGPWNLYSRFRLTPNSQAPIVDVSGYGLFLINNVLAAEGMGGTPDTVTVSEANSETATDVYSFPATTGTAAMLFYEKLPIAQRLRGLGEVGLFPLQNPAVQLQLFWTPNSGSSATPYNIYSTTALNSPYLVTNNATVTLASPTLEVVRDLWEVPQDAQDLPAFNFISSWTEETFQTALSGATQVTWKATPLSGILVRVIGYISDGATNTGIAPSTLTASNAVNLSYGAGVLKFAETGTAALTRQRDALGHDMPQGAYVYDLLGPDLTLQDSLNLFEVGNVQMQFNITAGLNSASTGKVLRQELMPISIAA